MDRLTKIVVLGWTSAALALEIWLLSSGWPGLPLLTLIVAAAMIGLGAFQRRAVALVLAFSYIFPALVGIWHGGSHYSPHEALWMAALVGVMLPDLVRSPWHIPTQWRGPLIMAALIVVFTSPIVILREIDLNPGLLTDMRGWNWGGATWPSIGVTWSLHVSLTLVVGLLWFDWLFGAPDLDFQAHVMTPLAVSASALAAVAIYQLVFDLQFLNETVYGTLGRASGTMYDANLSGTIAALWIGGTFLWIRRRWPRHGWVTAVLVVFYWLAVWASGSRTAFAFATIVTIGIGVALLKERQESRGRLAAIAGASFAALVAVVAVTSIVNPRIVGPLNRVWATLPSPSIASVQDFGAEMWNRNGYGAAATAMIRQEPLFGVGVGMFPSTARDFLESVGPDNAQNWLRHQLVEFGLLGSLGWIVWFVAFGAFVLHIRRSDAPSLWVTRGILLGFAAISMLGMPGQDVMVVITFWSIAFLHVSLAGGPARGQPLSRTTWAIVVATVLVVAAGTTELAMTRLRVPVRALTADWPYSYGFSSPQAAGGEEGFRRTRSHAVAVLDAPYRWLAVSVRLDAAGGEPVDVRVWTNGSPLLKGRLSGTGPLTAVLQLPAAGTRVLLEAGARRADSWRPFAFRGSEQLILVKWEFLDRAPAHFNGYTRPITS